MFRIVALLVLALTASAESTAFVGVNVVPMDSERVLLGQTVIVRDRVVSEIGAVADVEVPAGARVIDMRDYVTYGITTVRDLAGLDSVLATKARVDRGELLGPRIFVSSLLLVGPNAANPPFSFV